jgi:uncharacterized protein
MHIQPWHELKPGARGMLEGPGGKERAKRILGFLENPSAFVRQLDAWGVERTALVNYVAPETMGFTESVNEWISEYTRDHRERLIPVGSVHPRRVDGRRGAYKEVERLASKLEVPMLKLHPGHQLVWPDAYRNDSRGAQGHPPDGARYQQELEGLYEGCIDHDVVLLVHTGTSVFPGAINQSADPLILDTVAVDFPRLKIIAAHAGRPLWGEAACFIARRHENVYLDLSGIPPKRLLDFVPELPKLAHKCIWGTDWPGPGVPDEAPRVNVEAFLDQDLGLDEEGKKLVLDGTSRKLFP